ncbi:hypothetical protein MRX96_032981 [Rhipicephalus microplus]
MIYSTKKRLFGSQQCAGPAGSGGGAQHQSLFAVKPPGEGLPQLVNAAAPQLPTKALPHPPNAVPLQPSDAVRLQPSQRQATMSSCSRGGHRLRHLATEGRHNGRHPPPPHGAILPNERGTLPPSRLLPSKPGNINVYRVVVAEGMNCQGPTPNRKGVFQLYGVLPQLGQTMVLTSACPEQCACPAGSGVGAHAQHQFNFAVQPPALSHGCPAVPEVSYADMVFEYVDEKLTEELENRLLSLERPNATKEDRFKDKNRIKWILEILEM